MTIPSSPAASGLPGLLREARLSRAALESNIDAVLAARSAQDLVVDARADAYGHSLGVVVESAADRGIRRFRVSPGAMLPPGLVEESGREARDEEFALYGYSESLGGARLLPVLTLVAEVIAVKRVPAGSAVSYGYTYRTPHEGTIALVGLGYADGVPRLGSNLARAAVAGTQAPIAGRIAMDQFVLDLGDHTAGIGDEVTLWGGTGAPTIADWAAIAGRTPQNLTAGLGHRVARSWVEA